MYSFTTTERNGRSEKENGGKVCREKGARLLFLEEIYGLIFTEALLSVRPGGEQTSACSLKGFCSLVMQLLF